MSKEWRGPTAAQVLALRRKLVSPSAAQKVGTARQIYAAELRSGWDSYYTVHADVYDRRRWTKFPAGAIEAARHGVSRLVDCLRARKPMSDDDLAHLKRYIATRLRRRLWSPELVRALSRSPTEDDYDLLADLVESIGRRRGGVFDEPAHRAARLAAALLSLLPGRVPAKLRDAVIEYACELEGYESGAMTDADQFALVDRVKNILAHPKARGHKR